MSKVPVLDFIKTTLAEALEGKGSTVLIAISDILAVEEFARKGGMLEYDLSIIRLKRGTSYPVRGTPDEIYKRIKEACKD
jgi:hypothetical protein